MEFYIVNSFSDTKFKGNPAGVVIVDDFLETSLMQSVAKQLNLVETIFIRKDSAIAEEYSSRYFTPTKELPIAGHPTIAGLKILHEYYDIKADTDIKITTASKVVNATIGYEDRNKNPIYSLNMGNIIHGVDIDDRRLIVDALEISEIDLLDDLPIKVVDAGLGHIIVPVKTLESLFRIKRNIKLLSKVCQLYGAREVQAFTFETVNKKNDIHTRNICPREGIEDPACGIGNSALLSYVSTIDYGKKKLNIEQGYINNFESIIKGEIIDSSKVKIGGNAVVMAKGILLVN